MTQPIDPEELFCLNRRTFAVKFQSTYEKAFIPKSFIQFRILLPFNIPLHRGSFSLMNEDKTIYTYCFHDVRAKKAIDVEANLEPKYADCLVSKVEMILVSHSSPPEDEEFYSLCFDRLLDGLNIVISSYGILTKDIDAHRIGKESLGPTSLFRYVKLPNWENSELKLFLIHQNFPYLKTLTNSSIPQQLTHYCWLYRSSVNPFMLSEEMALNARRNLRDGNYPEAVLSAQISIEVFLANLYIQLRLEEDQCIQEAEQEWSDLPFMSAAKKQFHKRLGGEWDPTKANSAMGEWFKKTYCLRNKVVHRGYFPTFAETVDAIGKSETFRQYIIGRIKVNSSLYMNLWKYFDIKPPS